MASLSAAFSGSYAPEDVSFLLRRLDSREMQPVDLAQREQRIQSGSHHYSEMIGPEDAPSRQRVAIFRACLEANAQRMARDIAVLAAALAASAADGHLTLVSIARAGTPIGVLLLRQIRRCFPQLRSVHYSISVIRDRGVDAAALRSIMASHPAGSIRFIDGWTGKGTIARELAKSIRNDPGLPADLPSGLWVPLDVCGAAHWAASAEDYLIPSTILGGTISGLVSRSVLERDAPRDLWHGCVALDHLCRLDLSRWFIRHMDPLLAAVILPDKIQNASPGPQHLVQAKEFLTASLEEIGMRDRNRIKLGIGETVRVLLRRLPRTVWLRDTQSADAQLILRLAALREVPVELRPDLPFAATAVIGAAVPSA